MGILGKIRNSKQRLPRRHITSTMQSAYRIQKTQAVQPEQVALPQPAQPQEPCKKRKRSVGKRAQHRERGIARGFVSNPEDRRECVLQGREAAAAALEKKNQEEMKAVAQQRAALRARELRDHEVTSQQWHEAATLARNAASAIERGRRSEKWANEFVLGEDGEILPTPARRMVASAARMLETGHVNRSTALRTAAVRETELQADPGELSLLSMGSQAWYACESLFIPVTIVGVHQEEQPPFYTIRFDSGYERQTLREKLTPCERLVAPAIIPTPRP